MELRELRGMEIAATRTIRKRDGWWVVPSQAGNGLYRVQLCAEVCLPASALTLSLAGRIASIFSQPLLLFVANKTRMVL